jgi:hypothetical protein
MSSSSLSTWQGTCPPSSSPGRSAAVEIVGSSCTCPPLPSLSSPLQQVSHALSLHTLITPLSPLTSLAGSSLVWLAAGPPLQVPGRLPSSSTDRPAGLGAWLACATGARCFRSPLPSGGCQQVPCCSSSVSPSSPLLPVALPSCLDLQELACPPLSCTSP